MRPLLAVWLLGFAVPAAAQEQFQTNGVLRKVDPDRGSVEVFAGGQNRTLALAKDAKVLDQEGKELALGLKSAELKEGADVTLTLERSGGGPVLKTLRLGRSAGPGKGGAAAPEKVDTSALVPLSELGEKEYQGHKGGLYPGGKNERPAAHEARGVALAAEVKPLDPDGKPAAGGKIALLTVGMSNTSQASASFIQAADRDPDRNPALVIVNGAQGGMTAAKIQNPDDAAGARYWSTVDERLKAAGVTRAQVQAVWIKEADAGPTQGFPKYARTLEEELARIVQLLPGRFPNVKLCYLSSRTYGGYATTRLNPEPYAYESGFSVKWLVEGQIGGDAALNCDPARGAVKAPWLSWGPYLWANGATARADGLSYDAKDFGPDGTHPSAAGQEKVGRLLLEFFKGDATTRPWFRKK